MKILQARLADLTADQEGALLRRGRFQAPEVTRAVTAIIDDVRGEGDAALRRLARRFDGVELEAVEVERSALEEARSALDPDLLAALEQAAAAIRRFHRAQRPAPLEVEPRPGLRLGRRPDPLRRVGVYAPGGRASYPSSVLMGAIPAREAGVGEVVVCSPPGPDGLPPRAVLAACAVAGVDRVFAVGGAGAVAALAWGTDSIPRVDKVVGPGNAYVAEAKRQLVGVVGIDAPAGPSELLVIADGSAEARLVALEMLAQAEHDPDAAAVLVTTERPLVAAVAAELEGALTGMPRADTARAALETAGALLVAETPEEAVAFAERYAPEHLLLLTEEPRSLLSGVRAAGTVFLGRATSVAFGDYLTGANHVLPTGGAARSFSGLSTEDFVRWTTWQEMDDGAAAALAAPTALIAEAEGLPGHAAAARARASGEGSDLPGESSISPPVGFRAAYRDVLRYDPKRRSAEVDLSDNTNLFGTPPAARAVLAGATDEVRRYPSVYGDDLKAAVAGRFGVAPENVATGCGSDDLIDSALRAFCEPGDGVAFPAPTFPMADVFARMNAARPIPVPLARGGDVALDVDGMLAADAAVVYLCRPNNPTGTLFEREAVLRLLRESRGLVLLDEAYAEYAGESLVPEALASGRTLVLRTLSKAYGLAGLRVGYALGPAPLIAELEKSRGPYKVGGLAERAAVTALTEGRAWVEETVVAVRENRHRLAARLADLGLESLPSAANFLLVRVPDAEAFKAAAAARGIGIRAFTRLPGLGDCVRVTVGPWSAAERFLEAARAALATEVAR